MIRFFLLVYVVVYGGIQVYLYSKTRAAFPQMGHWRLLLGAFLVAMFLAPIAGWWVDRAGAVHLARIIAIAGYIWISLAFWFFLLFLASDLWNFAVWAVGHGLPAVRKASLPARPAFFAFSAIIAIAVIWGLVEASQIRVKEVMIRTPRLAPGSAPIRIVQIADVHLDLVVGRSRLEKIAGLIREARPDVLVSTGDLVDSSLGHLDGLPKILRDVPAPLGKFAVTGNHEYYAGLDNSLRFHEEAGFRMLRGESVVVDGRLRIAGVDDPAGRSVEAGTFLDENAALLPAAGRECTVLLKHRPAVQESSLGRFDLQLSGHVHGGQIFPFGYVVRMVYPLMPGRHELGSGSILYVSEGTGTWGPPLRVGAPPEVTLILLVPEDQGQGVVNQGT